jgi:uncharacterized protein (DUF849 family)
MLERNGESVREIDVVKAHIRWETKRLNERKAALNDVVHGLRIYMDHLKGLFTKAECASSNANLEEVVRLAGLGTRTRSSLFKLSKYLVEKELKEKLNEAEEEYRNTLREIEEIDRKLREANICPECKGEGKISEMRYIREDRMVRSVLHVQDCHLCEGRGRINLGD